MTAKPRTIGPEDEDRRSRPAGNPAEQRRAREAGVESLPDGEAEAERETSKPKDD